jgi:CRISPR/Cas system CSM-associated protein Csm3 (group 7 of RAMP superfamily)
VKHHHIYQNKQTMESIEEEDENQINATTTINAPTAIQRSPSNGGSLA